ncbi:MAG: hypothetical protein IPL52_01175 [Flavobacteriales bacterium]|nr:hypothetical protein [Flavobacteriales bacterium]
MKPSKHWAIAAVIGHTVLIACYTFPEAIVPERLRVLGQFYARPLFHQQWRLFAPDPPLCSCELQWSAAGAAWRSIDHGPDTYLQRRAVQSIARHVQAEVHAGDTVPAVPLMRAMRGMVYQGAFDTGRGHDPPTLQFRLVEHCVTDPHSPREREERITLLHAP